MKTPPSQKRLGRAAFTLMETLISATIASTALCTVLGLMSAGISDSKFCHQQAAALLLARRVAGEIQGQFTRSDQASASTSAPATTPDTTLHVEIYDAALNPLTAAGANDSALYPGGASQPNSVAYLVSWQMADPVPAQPGLSQLKITVETPPNVPQKNRHSYYYATFVDL